MNVLLNRAVKLLEKIDNELLKVDSTEKKYQVRQINPLTLDEVNEFLDDYYGEVSFLNENFNKAVHYDLTGYDEVYCNIEESLDPHISTFTKRIQNIETLRIFECIYKKVYEPEEELIIVQPFKEV